MDNLALTLKNDLSSEHAVKAALVKFCEENSSNFEIIGTTENKQLIVRSILKCINTSNEALHCWSSETVLYGLACLRILSRGKQSVALMSSVDSLGIIALLGDISSEQDKRKFDGDLQEQDVKVIVESVKCLCNIYLMNKHLASSSADLGILQGLAERLSLHCSMTLPHDVLYYDLRLLFLLTACDPDSRNLLRKKHNGIPLMNSIIDATLFGPCSAPSSSTSHSPVGGVPVRDNFSSPCQIPLTDNSMNVLCESLKIIFNQSLYLDEGYQLSDEEQSTISQLGHLLRTLLVSLPAQLSDLSLKTISHVAEVLVNMPGEFAHTLLLPPDSNITAALRDMYPQLYPKPVETWEIIEGGVINGVGMVYSVCLDHVIDNYNMAAIVCLLNYLHIRLCEPGGRNTLPPILTALRQLSKGHRSIRRFLRAQILPPLGKVTARPEEGESLKSKLVRLMTAGARQGAEEIVADLLFVLCKERTSRFIKYTGYGNAAGLLMSRGLLGGVPSKGAADYSSDEESSDTEEYLESQPKIDEMTGGPAQEGPSPLDSMTEEEKEQEALKLNDLIHRLNSQGIFKIMPLSEAPPTQDPESDDECD